jgi:hypothetical protein
MGRWVHDLTLLSGEQSVLTQRANRQVGWRALGGHLSLTDRRLVFEPNAVDRNSGGTRWECPLESIRSVQVERRSAPLWGPLARIRPRIFVSTGCGEEAFLVNHASEFGKAISRASEQPGG